MRRLKTQGGDIEHQTSTLVCSAVKVLMLDEQYADLMESIWHCERAWRLEDRINAVIKKDR
jgi:hypothetical protein